MQPMVCPCGRMLHEGPCPECGRGSRAFRSLEIDEETEFYKEKKVFSSKVLVARGISNSKICPTCGRPAVLQCKCSLGDCECKMGHKWHLCPVHKTKVALESDHANSDLCTCFAHPKNCLCGQCEGAI